MIATNVVTELAGPKVIRTAKRGGWLLKHPATNKGLAFPIEERERLGLMGLLPPAVLSIEDQVALELEHLAAKPTDLEKYIALAALHDRNEVLFYRVLVGHLAQLMPIVYTPTVGYACKAFSHIFRSARGVWLTPDDAPRMRRILRDSHRPDIRLIVVTDNERILGLGDQGCGGMGIPIGKLALYIAGAGIHPTKCLPISLDVGTNNPELLNDPYYAGHRHRRLAGPAYDHFIETFVDSVSEVFPHAIIQWEDFKKENAIRLLNRYQRRIPCFNDDIQGTAAVALAGILAAMRMLRAPIAEQRALFIGAGAASAGIARLMRSAMAQAGASSEILSRAHLLMDSHGLLHDGREYTEAYKREFAVSASALAHYGIDPKTQVTPEQIIAAFKPTILIGATATAGAFTEAMLSEMAKHAERPIIMPLSNPNAKAECSPAEATEWTGGRAVVATGSPFPDVVYRGETRTIGQANNVFIFPGLGLGAIISEVREITQDMFLIAARTLADFVSPERLDRGAIYPDQSELRAVSGAIAKNVVTFASKHNLGRQFSDAEAERIVEEVMWYPDYIPIEPIPS
jgi:malic enzyme